MAQYPIPQFIESESKIVFFLTFKQFFLLVGGGAFCILFYYLLPFPLFVILSLFTAGLVAAIAFLKINNMSIVTVFLNFLGFLTGAKVYVWKKKESSRPFKAQPHSEILNIPEPAAPKIKTSKLNTIKKLVETKK